MNLENFELHKIYKFKDRKDLEVIKDFLEKKYKKEIVYTLFRDNLVFFVNTNKFVQ
jgi:hypothetical protein